MQKLLIASTVILGIFLAGCNESGKGKPTKRHVSEESVSTHEKSHDSHEKKAKK